MYRCRMVKNVSCAIADAIFSEFRELELYVSIAGCLQMIAGKHTVIKTRFVGFFIAHS